MKLYQDHDPVKDKGKAVPIPKGPNPHKIVSRFYKVEPHPDTVKEFRIKPSRKQRIEATQRMKQATRRALALARN